MFGNMDWYGVGVGVELVGENRGELGLRENKSLGLLDSLSCFGTVGDVNDGDEEVDELNELSEDRFNNEDMGENADFSLFCCCCSSWAC